MRAELLSRLAHQASVLDRRGVDRDLVGAGFEQSAHVVGAAHPAADGKRHEAALGRAAHHVQNGAALLVARGDVEEAELISARLVVSGSRLDGVAGVAQIDELDAFDDATLFHVEAGYDTDLQHGGCASGVLAVPSHASPGW